MVPRPRPRMDLFFFVVMCLLVSTSSQQCSQLQDNDPLIGNYNSEDRNGLISTAFESQGFTNPTVMVLQAKVVCLSPGDVRDTFTSVSIVANYSCTSASFPECDNASSLSQFEFVCFSSANSFQWGIAVTNGIITTPPNANLSSDLRTNCSVCISNTTAVNITSYPDINHCIACPGTCSTEGLTQCITFNDCCNYYDNDTCVESCTLPARPNNENNCGSSTGAIGGIVIVVVIVTGIIFVVALISHVLWYQKRSHRASAVTTLTPPQEVQQARPVALLIPLAPSQEVQQALQVKQAQVHYTPLLPEPPELPNNKMSSNYNETSDKGHSERR